MTGSADAAPDPSCCCMCPFHAAVQNRGWLTRDAVGRARAHQATRKLVQVRLAHKDAACRGGSNGVRCAHKWDMWLTRVCYRPPPPAMNASKMLPPARHRSTHLPAWLPPVATAPSHSQHLPSPAQPHLRPAVAAPRGRAGWARTQTHGRRRWWDAPPHRCYPSPQMARPRAAPAGRRAAPRAPCGAWGGAAGQERREGSCRQQG